MRRISIAILLLILLFSMVSCSSADAKRLKDEVAEAVKNELENKAKEALDSAKDAAGKAIKDAEEQIKDAVGDKVQEGKDNLKDLIPEKKITKLSPPKEDDYPDSAEAETEISIFWKPVNDAQAYVVNWNLGNDNNSFKTTDTNSKIVIPNTKGIMHINIYACGSYDEKWIQSKPLDYRINITSSPRIFLENYDVYSQKLAEKAALYSMLAYTEYDYVFKPPYTQRNVNISDIYAKCVQEDNIWDYFTFKTGGKATKKPQALHETLNEEDFLHIKSENYNDKKEDNISYTLAYKTINGKDTLLAIVLRGTDTYEWYGNMDIGSEERHESFQQANIDLQGAISKYIDDNKLDNIRYFITGHSRGAAVGNLLAADLNEGTFNPKTKKAVFAYTFATPNNTTNSKPYGNIFNFVFKDDFVPQVPLEDTWRYSKYGKTYEAVTYEFYYGSEDGSRNDTFFRMMNEFVSLSDVKQKRKNTNASFDYEATKDVLDAFLETAPTVWDYNHTKLDMDAAPMHPFNIGEEDQTLHEFMRNYVARARIDGNWDYVRIFTDASSAHIGTKMKEIFNTGNDVHRIAKYFVDGLGERKSIGDTHEMFTYYVVLKLGGFNV